MRAKISPTETARKKRKTPVPGNFVFRGDLGGRKAAKSGPRDAKKGTSNFVCVI